MHPLHLERPYERESRTLSLWNVINVLQSAISHTEFLKCWHLISNNLSIRKKVEHQFRCKTYLIFFWSNYFIAELIGSKTKQMIWWKHNNQWINTTKTSSNCCTSACYFEWRAPSGQSSLTIAINQVFRENDIVLLAHRTEHVLILYNWLCWYSM